MSDLWRIVTRMVWIDAVDILVIALLLYLIFRFIQGTHTSVPLRGFVLLLATSVLIYFLARVLQLEGLMSIFRNLGVVMILLLIVVFQSDLRRGLADLGRIKFVRRLFSRGDEGLAEIARACTEMSSRRTGALIAMERGVPLRPWIDRGTPLEALITSETIRSLFTTQAPLHDGALVVRGERLAAAGCILPLTATENLARNLGTRHRAALGLSEETDAVVIVVSEETGRISLAADGKLERVSEEQALEDRLAELLGVKTDAD